MKKLLTAALALAALGAQAAGPYDGIYQSATNLNAFLSVNTTGTRIIVANLNALAPNNVPLATPIGVYTPLQTTAWDLWTGTINLSTSVANVSGNAFYGACQQSVQMTFDPNTLNPTYVSLTVYSPKQTLAGTAQGINCSKILTNTVTTATYNKL
jgi:hypothetical protein